MEKRNKGWRVQQRKLHYVKRLKRYVSGYFFRNCVDLDGECFYSPTWKDLYEHNYDPKLRNTGTPCSCWLCRGERYKRQEFKKDTNDELNNSF